MRLKRADTKDWKIPTKVYDVEKKELLAVCESRFAAAKYLGVDPGIIRWAFDKKARIYKNKLGIVACIR
jgi:hypothetical protein